jgi:hypothetical protein
MKKLSIIGFLVTAILYLLAAYSVGSAYPGAMLRRVIASVQPASAEIKFSAEIIRGHSGRRVYLFHGLDLKKTSWDVAPYDKLTKYLKASGAQIIIVQLPRISMFDFKDLSYCKAFSSLFDRTQAFLGPSRETTVIGVSWGGWHAMQVGLKADRMLLLKPVTQPNTLDEFWQAETSKCQLSRSQDSMAIFSASDTRVGDATKALSGVPTMQATLGDHGVVTADIEAAISWLDADGLSDEWVANSVSARSE